MTGRELLANWFKAQETGVALPCPRCGRMTMKENVSENYESLVADVHVCNDCHYYENKQYKVSSYRELPPLEADDSNIANWWLVSEALGVTIEKPKRHYYLDVVRRAHLTDQDIDDIMAAALEGGINYWCCNAEVIEDQYLGEYASDQISRGGSLRLYDREEDEKHELTLNKFLTGFKIACKSGYGDDWFDEEGNVDAGQIDADAADAIVQCALFGEIVYG